MEWKEHWSSHGVKKMSLLMYFCIHLFLVFAIFFRFQIVRCVLMHHQRDLMVICIS
jgi:hypothetical protein